MVLIFGIATVAAAAVKAYNRLSTHQVQTVVRHITQSTSVLMALTTAVQWVLSGLQGLTRLAAPPVPGYSNAQITVGRPAAVAA